MLSSPTIGAWLAGSMSLSVGATFTLLGSNINRIPEFLNDSVISVERTWSPEFLG